MCKKMNELQQVLDSNDELRWRLNEMIAAFDGDKTDDRAVFEAVIVPIAEEAGIAITYDEVLAAAATELSDEELDAVAGGAGRVFMNVMKRFRIGGPHSTFA